MAVSILTFHNQPQFHANIQKGQPKQILIYLFKSCLKFCKRILNLFEVSLVSNKNILIGVGHAL